MAVSVLNQPAGQFSPVYSDVRKGALQITHEFFTDKVKDLLKGNVLAGKWLLDAISKGQLGLCKKNKILVVKKIETMNGVSETGIDILGTAELPEKAMKFFGAMQKLSNSPNGSTIQGGIKEGTGFIGSSCSGISLISRVFPISSEAMKNVKGIGGVAGVIGGVNSAIENVGKMCKSIKHGPTVGLYVINLASNISYIAAGVLGLLSLAGAMTVLPWVMLATLTSGLLFTMGGFFYERLVNPEGKQDDLEKVKANNLAHILFLRTQATSSV